MAYPAHPFRVNLMMLAFLLIGALIIIHYIDHRAGGE